jgi:hypothetical protein
MMSKEGISFPDLDGTNVRVGIIRTRYAALFNSTQSFAYDFSDFCSIVCIISAMVFAVNLLHTVIDCCCSGVSLGAVRDRLDISASKTNSNNLPRSLLTGTLQ